MATSATQRVVDFICDTQAGEIPAEAREMGRRALLDTIGVTLAGVNEESARISRELLDVEGGNGLATVLGTSLRTSLAGAALTNGTAGHALDYDDVGGHMGGHPSIPLTPALLAASESVGAPGADVVTAFVIGFEVECKVGRALGRSHYARGFHQTSTLGPLGAAAACARLWRLDKQQTAHALGIASSLSGGLRQNFGSMTKPLQAGNAARGGMMAALLAQRGFTGGTDILDGPIGFVRVFAPAEDSDIELLDDFGSPWEVLDPGISVKKYPCCFVTHRAADVTLSMAEEHNLTLDDLDHAEVHVAGGSLGPNETIGPLIHHRPTTGLEGKFSMEYVVTSAVHDRQIKFANFEDDQVARPDVQAFIERFKTVADSKPHAAADRGDDGVTGAGYHVVELHTKDGRVLADSVSQPRGGPRDPLSWEELREKYEDCAVRALAPEAIGRSADMIVALDELADVRELTGELATIAG
jgi:2-methylcitrate dehydratase PrpD